MSEKIKFRFELNRGRKGVPLHKFSDIMTQCEKFLTFFMADLDISTSGGQWLVCNLKEGSAIGDVMYVGEVSATEENEYNYYFEQVLRNPQEAANGKIKRKTILQYIHIADSLDPDESINFGLYKNGEKELQPYELSKKDAIGLIDVIEDFTEYHGAIQGVIHELNKGHMPPYFRIRDLASKKLIKCFFSYKLYDRVIELLHNKDAIVIVSGLITASRSDRHIDHMNISVDDHLKLAPEYKEGDLEKFIGSSPDFLGKQTFQEFMDEIRGRNE